MSSAIDPVTVVSVCSLVCLFVFRRDTMLTNILVFMSSSFITILFSLLEMKPYQMRIPTPHKENDTTKVSHFPTFK